MRTTSYREDKLKAEAKHSAQLRGHRLTRFKRASTAGSVYWDAKCYDCAATVRVTPNPKPNEINIGGTAVALTCGVSPTNPLSRSNHA